MATQFRLSELEGQRVHIGWKILNGSEGGIGNGGNGNSQPQRHEAGFPSRDW